jgi:hypothetical protein
MTQNKDRLKGKIWDTRYSIMITNDKKGWEKLEELENKYDYDKAPEYKKDEWWDIMIRYTFWGLEVIETRPYLLWLQSTGLKDKNGNLIYEGDIVKWLERKYVINWIDDEACFKAVSVDNEITTTLKLHEHCEVLGNKFENPELLK